MKTGTGARDRIIQVYLVPGFFGFTSLGAMNYFHRVAETLRTSFERLHQKIEILSCQTLPTGSLKKRAERLLKEVIRSGGRDADQIHFVGHSTGGLDVRLLTTPGVRLSEGRAEIEIGKKTRSVITVSTPHFGTPLSSFFTTFQGRHILQLLAALSTTTQARHSIFWASQAIQMAARMDDWLGRRNTWLDMVSDRLLRRITVDKHDPIWTFLDEIGSDQGAILQLTPEGMNLYNAAVVDSPDIEYLSIVNAAPGFRQMGLAKAVQSNPLMMGIFQMLHTICSREPRHYPYPSPSGNFAGRIQKALPFDLNPSTNDGIVPTLSQVYGRLLDTVIADHMDIVGHFRNSGNQTATDWLPSGAEFGEERFQRVWNNVARAISRRI